MSQSSKVLALLLLACTLEFTFGVNIANIGGKVMVATDLELSKSLWGIQSAVKNGFKFNKVSDAIKLLQQCEYAEMILGEATDNNKLALAEEIKSVLQNPTVSEVCSLSLKDVEEKYAKLDSIYDVDNMAYLSVGKIAEFEEIAAEIKAARKVSLLLTPYTELKKIELGEALLKDGARDVAVLSQELEPHSDLMNLETNYKTGCQIKNIKKICKLVRGTRDEEEIKKVGPEDIDKFIDLMGEYKENKQKIMLLEAKSDVSLNDVRTICSEIRATIYLRAVRQIDNFLRLGYVQQDQVNYNLQNDKDLRLYYNVNKFCSTL